MLPTSLLPTSFSLGTIVIGIFFSIIGYAAWRYGRQQQSGRHMLLGVALMGYGYVVPSLWLNAVIGGVLTLLLFWP